MTKLEALIEVLKLEGFEVEIVDGLILKYYSNQDSTGFNVGEQTFEVYTANEMEDNLLVIAEEIYNDLIVEMVRATQRMMCSGYVFEEVNRNNVIDNITQELNYFEEIEDCICLGNAGKYTVCELI
jgi:hypothetical protein